MSEENKAPVGDQPKEDEKGGLNAHFKKHWYLYAAGFGAAVLIISTISLKSKANQAQSAGATDPSATGYVGHVDTMAGGFPDTSNYDSVMSMLSGLNSTEAQNYTLLSQIAKGQTPTQSPPISSGPSTQPTPAPPQSWFATIRARFSAPEVSIWDKGTLGGIPIHASADPSSKIIGYDPYGSSQMFIGGPIAGKQNVNTNLWGKTPGGGYISMYDIRS